jgi:pyridoxamine 5'-phosphate oxidase
MSGTEGDDKAIDLGGMRRDYEDPAGSTVDFRAVPFGEADLAADWLTQFRRWFDDAVAARLPEPNAMVLATATRDGRPSARTVLLKQLDERGFMFATNYRSRKGSELTANPYASLVFPWFPMTRQVVVCGSAARIAPEESAAYFATRPRGSQIGAWASPQSQVVADRAELDRSERATVERFAGIDDIPLPPHWGGFRVRPDTVEFWQGRTSRLHDRLRFRRVAASGGGRDEWVVERLGP